MLAEDEGAVTRMLAPGSLFDPSRQKVDLKQKIERRSEGEDREDREDRDL